jgi:hypothetical protein
MSNLNISQDQESLIRNAVIILLTNTKTEWNDWNIQNTGVEINCTINGIEVDFVRLVQEVNSSFEGRVNEAVQEIVKTQLQDLSESLSEIARRIGNTQKELRLSNIYFDD